MSRRANLVAAAVAVLLLTGACGAPAGDPVIAAPESDTAPTSTADDDVIGSTTDTPPQTEPLIVDTTLPTVRPNGLESFGAGTAVVSSGPISVLIADTADLQRQGLMLVEDLGEWDGMWFAFSEDRDGGFWMKDTLLPLSIAWIDSSGTVVAVADMDPCLEDPCVVYSPGTTYRHALEVEQGRLTELGVVVGAAVVRP